ncbi:MAG: choice-of-anchor B family protein [Saprospiraceae bacterium]
MKIYLLITYLFLFFIGQNFGQAIEANLLGQWSDSTIIGSTNHTNVYNEIWGYAVNNHEYAIIGTTAGTHFIDVTNPSAPFQVFFVAGKVQGGQIVHRDYHDYRGYLYAAAGEGNNSTLQIIDMRQLPDMVTVVYDQKDIFRTAHNIFIDTTTAKLYALAARGDINGYTPLRTFDISDPINPIVLGDYNNFGGITPSHVHDAYVDNNIAFLNLGNDGLAIVDFTDDANPQTLSTVTNYPSRGYNHSGWISTDCSTYYLGDENHGFDLKVIDVTDLCEPEIGKTFDAQVDNATSITHNQVVACNYLYVSYYYDGLRIYDISNPTEPALVRYFDTYSPPNGTQYRGAWGVYPFLPSGNILLSDMQGGLFVFEGMNDNCNSQSRNSNCLQSQICSLTPTKDFSLFNEIKLSPNPMIDRTSLIVNLSEALDNLEVSLMTINGQVVKNWQYQNLIAGANDFSILLPNSLPKGVYLLSLRSEQFKITKKVMVGR